MTVGSTLMAAAFSLTYSVVCRFIKNKVNLWFSILPVVFIAILIQPHFSRPVRTFLGSLIFSIQHPIILISIIASVNTNNSKGLRLVMVSMFVAFSAFIIRIVSEIMMPQIYTFLLSSHFPQVIVNLMLLIALIMFVLGLLLMQIETDENDLIQVNMVLERKNRTLKRKKKNLTELNKELSFARDLAQEGSRAKSVFFANMSHEIRTPMNAILGFCELMKMKTTDKESSHFLEIIDTNAKTLMQIIGNILDLSKFETGVDDGAVQVNISTVFPNGINYCGTKYSSTDKFFIGINGYVTFGQSYGGYTAVGLPVTPYAMVAGFYTDLMCSTNGGYVFVDLDTTASDPCVTVTFYDSYEYPNNIANRDRFQIRIHRVGTDVLNGDPAAVEIRYNKLALSAHTADGGWTDGKGSGSVPTLKYGRVKDAFFGSPPTLMLKNYFSTRVSLMLKNIIHIKIWKQLFYLAQCL